MTGLAPWEFEFPFPGSLISTFLVQPHTLDAAGGIRSALLHSRSVGGNLPTDYCLSNSPTDNCHSLNLTLDAAGGIWTALLHSGHGSQALIR